MPAEDFIKEIEAKKLKAVQDRLKKEKPNQKFFVTKDKTQFYSPLHAAVKANVPAIVEALLAAAGDVSALDHEGHTPLHWATLVNSKDSVQIAEALLAKKASLTVGTKAGYTPLQLAASRGAALLIPALSPGGAGLESACSGGTPLQLALATGSMETVDALVKAGAKLGAQDAFGMTSLMQLIKIGKYNEARLLMMKGDCHVNAKMASPPGHTALMMAVMAAPAGDQFPDITLVDALLMKGASPDEQDVPDKNTPIMWAIINKKDALAQRLIKSSQQINARNKNQQSALSLALTTGSDDALMGAILSAGADVTVNGVKLLTEAITSKRDGLAAQFIKVMKEKDLTSVDVNFRSLASTGMPQSALAFLARFEKEQSDKLPIDDAGNTNLHLLAEHGAPFELVTGLVALGLGPNTVNKAGDTPLHIAAKAGHKEVCRALVTTGADILKRNAKNRRPADVPKLPDGMKEFLQQMEEEAKERKANKQSELWDEKMRATQTESALIVRGL